MVSGSSAFALFSLSGELILVSQRAYLLRKQSNTLNAPAWPHPGAQV